MKKIIIMVALWTISCSDKSSTGSDNRYPADRHAETEFLKYASLLPVLKLPFETNCEKCCNHSNVDYNNELIAKYKPQGASIMGLLFRTSDYVAILVTYPADALVPSVKVYNPEGTLIEEKTFMTGYCGGDFEYYGQQFLIINSDRSISTIDTAYYLKMDTVDFHIIDTTRVEIMKKNFLITDEGKLIEVDTP